MEVAEENVMFYIYDLLKQSRPCVTGFKIVFSAYPTDPCLYVRTHLLHCIEAIKTLKIVETGLFISYKKPHMRGSVQTISRWLQQLMSQAGINADVFTSHSTRAAATSAARAMDVPIDHILPAAGWPNELVFQQFYHRPIVDQRLFAISLLNSV